MAVGGPWALSLTKKKVVVLKDSPAPPPGLYTTPDTHTQVASWAPVAGVDESARRHGGAQPALVVGGPPHPGTARGVRVARGHARVVAAHRQRGQEGPPGVLVTVHKQRATPCDTQQRNTPRPSSTAIPQPGTAAEYEFCNCQNYEKKIPKIAANYSEN